MSTKKLVLVSAILISTAACSNQPKQESASTVPVATSARTPTGQEVKMNDLIYNVPATQEDIPGLRSFRVVMPDVLYRGGNSGGGQLPLKDTGLKALSDRQFSAAVYMYPNSFNPKANTYGLNYTVFGPGGIKDRQSIHNFLSKVKDIIENKKGPMYIHCWNGWHASGEMATYALMQFCGLRNPKPGTGETQANMKYTPQKYWDANADAGKGTVKRVQNFVIFDDLRISEADAARVCPR